MERFIWAYRYYWSMVDIKKLLPIIIGALLIISLLSVALARTTDLYFFDDFSDGKYEGRDDGYPEWTVHHGIWMVDRQAFTEYWRMRLTSDSGNDEGRISAEHHQAYGTWELDFEFDTTGNGGNQQVAFYFIMDQPDPIDASGYYVIIRGNGDLLMARTDNGIPTNIITSSWPPSSLRHVLLIERDENSGQFNFYLDGEFKGSTTDNTYDTCTNLGFWVTGHYASDNHRIHGINTSEEPVHIPEFPGGVLIPAVLMISSLIVVKKLIKDDL